MSFKIVIINIHFIIYVIGTEEIVKRRKKEKLIQKCVTQYDNEKNYKRK